MGRYRHLRPANQRGPHGRPGPTRRSVLNLKQAYELIEDPHRKRKVRGGWDDQPKRGGGRKRRR